MVVTLGLVACNKDDAALDNVAPMQKSPMQEEMIPIAKLTDKGDIELLFLQRDVQEFFNREFPDVKLVFVEVYDENKNGKDAGVLFQVYYEKEKVAVTLINLSAILNDGVYFVSQKSMLSAKTPCCTTNNEQCALAMTCKPKTDKCGNWSCPSCSNGGSCTKCNSNNTLAQVSTLCRALDYAVR